jgi:hypothetical protein
MSFNLPAAAACAAALFLPRLLAQDYRRADVHRGFRPEPAWTS